MNQLTDTAFPSHRVIDSYGHPIFWLVRLFDREHRPVWVNALQVSAIGAVTTPSVVGAWAQCEVVSTTHQWVAYSEDDLDTTAGNFRDAVLA